jgi:hypothetical protein
VSAGTLSRDAATQPDSAARGTPLANGPGAFAGGTRVLARWVAFWARREPATSLALTRILVGAVLFLDMVLAKYKGAMPALLSPPPQGMGTGAAAFPEFLAAPTAAGSDGVAFFWWAMVLVSSLMFALGLFYKASGVLLVLVLVNFARFDPDGDAIDSLYRVVVPILTLSGAHASFSFDAWIARKIKKPPPALVPAWPRYLLVLQLLWMYFSAGHCRDDAAWWPQGGFSAIGNVMGDPHFARFNPGSLVSLYPVTQMATAISMTFELSAPFMIILTWLRKSGGGRWGAALRTWRIRWIWLGAGAALHLGIALTMTLGCFPYGVLALYPLFLHPEEHAQLGEALRRGLARRRPISNAE